MKTSFYGIALEGWPFVLLPAIAASFLLAGEAPALAILPALLCLLAILKFHDPDREVPADPRGVLSPVDGMVVDIDRGEEGFRVLLRITAFGAYALRAPTEGKILESGHGLRIRTDEGEEVALRLRGPRWLPSAAVIDYGERIGQGQQCGVLRTARVAEVWLPADAEIIVRRGAKVRAGETVLGRFPAENGTGD